MTTTPNPTVEQIVADAITAYWADEERSGPNRGPLAHDFACGEAAAAALRAHGLLSEAAPNEEQIERAARALEEAAEVVELDMGRGFTGSDDHVATANAEAWLRARAAEIREGKSDVAL